MTFGRWRARTGRSTLLATCAMRRRWRTPAKVRGGQVVAAVTYAHRAVLLLRCCVTAPRSAQSSLLISMQAQARLGCFNSHKLLRTCCVAMCTNTISCPLPTHPGMDVVFHVATAAPTAANAHNEALMRAVNIDGTQVGAGSRRRMVCRRQREAAARLPALCQHAAH